MTDAQDRTASLAQLTLLAQPNVEPTLTTTPTTGEVDVILDKHKLATRWVTTTLFTFGSKIAPTVRNGHWYTVTTEGTTGSTEPTWPTGNESTLTDGTAKFKESGIDSTSVYDLRGAVRECWQLKASKASEMIQSSDSGSENMIFDHCQMMAEQYLTPMVV